MRPLQKSLIIVALAALALIVVRLLSPEDTWLCRDGQWVKHGNPANPMPTKPCT